MIIEDGITAIDGTFSACFSIKSVVMPGFCGKIEDDSFITVGTLKQ